MVALNQQILIIGTVWPEPGSSAAGSRMIQLIRLFLEQGWKITFACSASLSEFSFDLEKIGVTKEVIQLNSSTFDEFVKQLNPAIVLFDRFMIEEQYGWRVAEHCPFALRILDTEDLHCLRAARYTALKENREVKLKDYIGDVAKREIASIYRCDISLIISTFEMQLLQEVYRVSDELLHHLPFLVEEVKTDYPSFNDRSNFITIGNFLHPPNVDALIYLMKEIWPLIRSQLPGVNVFNYGAYPSERVLQFHKPEEGFYVLGRTDNVSRVFSEARVCLAPLRFGAGLKGKLIDSMIYGTPSVTTSIGAEGMHGDLEWNGLIADGGSNFANAAVRLYENESLWMNAQVQGKELINRLYKKSEHGPLLINKITSLQSSLQNHRLQNFTGAMLMHHTLASTKYMSRWIEAKNNIKM
jgi:glycosyltransferase involved in cell wall biosynthesis